MAKNIFNRYIWLADTVYRAGKITFEEINRKWLRTDWSEGKDLPLRTFHNHRTAIEELFDINIECNGYNQYYIENKDDIQQNNLRSWLLNTFTVNNLLNESKSLKNRILFEDIPSGQRFLTTIIEAMRDEVCVKFQYQAFWMDNVGDFEIEPYCLKIFKQRWYVIGKNRSINVIRRYSLDRIKDIFTTDTKFKLPETFKPEEHFQNAFGILVDPNIQAWTVKIKAFGNRRKYLQTLPLHPSQEEIESNSEFSIFQYYMAPTPDFKQELLSCGDEIEVLSPLSFRNEIAETVNKMKKLYKKIT
ncbi:WYL domain-containing protein [Bacteroidia bacterium]|nr:WYL domain-containing protein [Bacteroidia bacterium]